jgi:hypothetical protein
VKLFIHVEEPSMEETLNILRPQLIDHSVSFKIINHGSKQKLLSDLPARMRGYAQRLANEDIRVLVAVDRDNDQCHILKRRLELAASSAALSTKSNPDARGHFRIVNRIVIEELEAWFFGDVPALCRAYPGVPESLSMKAGLRDPDAIAGGTWERLLKVLQEAGHYRSAENLPKIEVARKVASAMNVSASRSQSFNHFVSGLRSLLSGSMQ